MWTFYNALLHIKDIFGPHGRDQALQKVKRTRLKNKCLAVSVLNTKQEGMNSILVCQNNKNASYAVGSKRRSKK